MRAVALGMIGYGPDTDDVVQDAALVAVCRITDVRNPAAIGPWPRTVVRNECRMRLRSRRVGDQGGETLSALRSEDPMPEELIDRQILQDWVWHAIEELSPSLRVVAMLRYSAMRPPTSRSRRVRAADRHGPQPAQPGQGQIDRGAVSYGRACPREHLRQA